MVHVELVILAHLNSSLDQPVKNAILRVQHVAVLFQQTAYPAQDQTNYIKTRLVGYVTRQDLTLQHLLSVSTADKPARHVQMLLLVAHVSQAIAGSRRLKIASSALTILLTT